MVIYKPEHLKTAERTQEKGLRGVFVKESVPLYSHIQYIVIEDCLLI